MAISSLTGQPTFVGGITLQTEEEADEEVTPSITIEDLELSVRAYNCLKRASINSLPELLKKSEYDLLNIKNFGKKSSDEVIEKLKQFGLDLAPNPEDIEELI
jgi:DNA-directed RNA polymerase subunit alpha